MDASCVINQELQIPFEYMTAHSRPERVKCIVHISWLRSILTTGELSQFVEHDKLSSAEVSAWLKQGENFGPLWQKILITVIDKPNKTVIPLPRPRTGARPDIQLTFSQTCSYVAQTNYKNIWKEAYKKYSNTSFNGKMSERQCKINLMDCGEVLREVVGRAYGCPIINLNGGAAPEQLELSNQFEAHHNLLPAAIALETDHCFLILQEYEYEHSLLDCVRFSPALLSGNYAKPLFIIYQLLRLMRQLHDNGLVLGDITLSDILVSDNLWIQVLPRLEANIYTVPDVSCNKHEDQLIQQTTPDEPCSAASQLTAVESQTLSQSADNNQLMRDRERELGRLCEAWVRGALSNFDYLTALNRLAGRRYGDPRSHHVFPWVTDFSSRSGCSWRDLTRSKFRLNKGDRQLDLTYDLPPGAGLNQVPHHVSDVLSEITYYVYLCRVTPRAVLQKYVRPQWVPAEYPSSIQRLQEWTPDECIPEFFTDPTVFKSIHADLADLEVPSWAESAEDLVSAHRAILESAHVSDRLHHWIDLTFGYKLSGAAAVKSKNVCLQLVDGHTRLTDVGVVQLFTQPHPPHVSPNPYLSKTPPVFGHRDRKRGTCDEEDGGHSSGVEDEDVQITRSSPSGLSRILSRSRTSLHTTSGAPSTSTPLSPSSEQQQQQQQQDKSPPASIVLPRDYKPVAALVACEALHNFLNRTCQLMPPESAADGRLAAPHDSCSYKQVVAARRVQEMVVLGCLIVELFAPSKLHVFGCALQQQQQQHPSPTHPPHPSTALQRRADICRRLSLAAATAQLLPRCVRQLVQQLLGGSGEPVTPLGTPPPSAHQLLQPSLSSCVLPFPDNYAQVYNMFRCLQEYDSALLDLKRVMIKDSLDGVNRTEGLSLLAERINELKVKSLVEDIENLVERASASLVSTPAWLPLLLPHILPLLSSNETRVTAAWYLFDPIARALGPVQSRQILLEPMMKLYDREAVTEAECENANRLKKRIKIYHRSFLLRLIVRFGLKTFLEHFTRPLVEAVGGYHDFDSTASSGIRASSSMAGGNYGDVDESVDDALYPGNALSPLDEDSSLDSERNATESRTETEEDAGISARPETEVFVFEGEDSETEDTAESKTLHNSLLIDQLSIDEQTTTADELPLDDGQGHAANPRSPTIDIPPASLAVGEGEGEAHWRSRQLSDDSSSCGGAAMEYTKLYVREVCEVSGESAVWLAHRLGPMLSARFLTRDLLRMLALCYTGADNLATLPAVQQAAAAAAQQSGNAAPQMVLVGDEAAGKVLECLALITALYGDQFVVLQFLPHIGDLISLCKRKLTLNLEGGLISCLVLFKHVLPFISDAVLAEILQDVILKTVIQPCVRLVSSSRLCLPSCGVARCVLAVRLLECIYTLAVRLTTVEQRLQLVNTLQRYFLAFSKPRLHQCASRHSATARSDEKDGASRVREYDSADSCSPPRASSPSAASKTSSSDDQRSKTLEEIKKVLGPSLAYLSFTTFANFFGEGFMEQTLKNYDLIQELCRQYKQEQASLGQPVPGPIDIPYILESQPDTADEVGSFGTVIGNRIDLKEPIAKSSSPGIAGSVEDAGLVQKRMDNSNRHLKGNWLAYWEHEIGRSGKDTRFNVKQIKLQSFGGHTNSIRALHVLDNENSFFSASRDKTVKLWSLRSQGDGTSTTSPQYTYSGHRKCVVSLAFVWRVRLAASSDSVVHVWDPFVGRRLGYSCARLAPVNLVRALPAPSACLLAATMDAAVKLLDARTAMGLGDIKVSLNATGGVIRCMAVSQGKHWVALGQASGQLTILDLRTGTVLASWRGHEGEVLQLAAVDDQTIVSSSLDQAVSVWNAADGKLICHMKGPTEPFHCLSVQGGELISGTTANRVGVHTAFDAAATYTSTRLRTDSLKGVLTVMEVLPLNRLILLGADTGAISLIC